MYSYGSPHMAAQKQDDQLERTFSSYVRIQVVVLKTYLGRWTIGSSGERGSGISVLPARYDDDDDDDDDDIYIIFQQSVQRCHICDNSFSSLCKEQPSAAENEADYDWSSPSNLFPFIYANNAILKQGSERPLYDLSAMIIMMTLR